MQWLDKNYIRLVSQVIFCNITIKDCNKTNCTSGDDGIEGTWKLVRVDITGCNDASENQSVVAGTLTCDVYCVDETITIGTESFTTVSTIGFLGSTETTTTEGTYTINGDQITTCEGTDCVTGTFEVDGDEMTFIEVDTDTGCTATATYSRQ